MIMVSKTKLLRLTREKIKRGKLQCIYCAGREVGIQEDHAPPRVMFARKDRPDGLIFPACDRCNQGSKDTDQIAGWLSRFFPPGAVPLSELKKITVAIQNNYPEVASSLQYKGGDDKHVVVEFDQYIVRALELFAAKMGFALHYELTGRIVPAAGAVSGHFFTNYHARTKQLPAELFKVFSEGKANTLWQGRKSVGGQFFYASEQLSSATETVHLCGFRQAFITLSFVREGGAFPNPSAPIYTPGCLQQRYPFGLPRLGTATLAARRARALGRI